jgi:hypothetical protein
MVGIMTNHVNIDGTWRDVNLYELLNPNNTNDELWTHYT